MEKQFRTNQNNYIQPKRALGCISALIRIRVGGGVKHLPVGRSSPPIDSGGDAMCR